MTKEKVVIIGGGQAALSFVAKMRTLGSTAQMTMISNEPELPYQRPPLSKAYLLGEMEKARIFLRPESWYEENEIEVRTNTRAVSIDRKAKLVTLREGKIHYDKLFIATGSRPRDLPESLSRNATNLYTIRTLVDVEKMRAEFVRGRTLVVIGGGYIGLEAAAVARKFGCEVTLIEATPRILGRVACAETANYMRTLHHQNDVEIMEGIGIREFAFDNDQICAVHLENGDKINCDFVIAGIGIHTNSEIAETAGIACDQGILVNEYCRTNDPDIYAAGDCARFLYQGQFVRLESVQNAIDQAENAALNAMGQATKYRPMPWFWSDQYDMSLQIAGLNLGYDDVVVRDEEGVISHWYYHSDQLISVDAFNAPRAFMIAKRILAADNNVPKEIVIDPKADLKPFMR